eukprot:9147683-Alexandrium_andersonii.AAC.1
MCRGPRLRLIEQDRAVALWASRDDSLIHMDVLPLLGRSRGDASWVGTPSRSPDHLVQVRCSVPALGEE